MAEKKLSKANEILIDLVLEVMPINQQFSIFYGLFDTIKKNIHKEDFDNDLVAEIVALTNRNDEAVRPFLLQHDYIKPINNSTHLDISTEKGQKAQEIKGHKNYLDWDKSEKEKLSKGDIPKINTIIYDIFKILVAAVVGIIIGRYSCNQSTKVDNDQLKTQQQRKAEEHNTTSSNLAKQNQQILKNDST